jgi:hypothetical protein
MMFMRIFLRAFLKLYNNREHTIASGIILLNEQYDVHRSVVNNNMKAYVLYFFTLVNIIDIIHH